MGRDTIELVLRVLRERRLPTLDVTGGAPELNPHFRHLVSSARALGTRVIDRCNLTILNEPGFEDLAEYLASERVEVTASLPCYTKDNVDRQRGNDVFESSILGLRKLNALGYGREGSGLALNLVYNPLGPFLPPRAGKARSRLQARARQPFRHRVQSPVHAGEHADRALRLDARVARQVRGVHGAAAQRAQSGEPRRRHVPHAGLGRLARLSVRLRLQPDARHSAVDRGQAPAPPVRPARRGSRPARRSRSPSIATAARQARDRPAAVRSGDVIPAKADPSSFPRLDEAEFRLSGKTACCLDRVPRATGGSRNASLVDGGKKRSASTPEGAASLAATGAVCAARTRDPDEHGCSRRGRRHAALPARRLPAPGERHCRNRRHARRTVIGGAGSMSGSKEARRCFPSSPR